MAGWLGSYQLMDYATAAESSEAVTEAATKTAPEWVAPFVLAVPVASYLLFTLYRSKVGDFFLPIGAPFAERVFQMIGIDHLESKED